MAAASCTSHAVSWDTVSGKMYSYPLLFLSSPVSPERAFGPTLLLIGWLTGWNPARAQDIYAIRHFLEVGKSCVFLFKSEKPRVTQISHTTWLLVLGQLQIYFFLNEARKSFQTSVNSAHQATGSSGISNNSFRKPRSTSDAWSAEVASPVLDKFKSTKVHLESPNTES